jgi:hypothetical protein
LELVFQKRVFLLDTTLLIKFVKLAAGRWFSQYTPPIKQDSHDITEILLKVITYIKNSFEIQRTMKMKKSRNKKYLLTAG